jgi:hypothetical protein
LWNEQISETHSMQHFCADPVHDSKANIGSILGGVDMDPERPFAEGRIDHLDDCFSDRRSVGIGRHNGTECFQYLLAKALIGARFVFGDAGFIPRAGPNGQSDWCHQ